MRYNNPFRKNSVNHLALATIVSSLGVLNEKGGTAMRKHCMAELQTATGKKEGSIGAAYTTAKREAVAQGIVEEFGRGGKSVPVVVRKVTVVTEEGRKVKQKGVTEAEAYALIDQAESAKQPKLAILEHLQQADEQAAKEAKRQAEREAKAKAKADAAAAKKAEKAAKQPSKASNKGNAKGKASEKRATANA